MRFVYSIILTLLTLVSTDYHAAFRIGFEVGKDYIVEELCQEKDKEVNLCQGSCIIAQQVQKQRETEEEPSPEFNDVRPTWPVIQSNSNQPAIFVFARELAFNDFPLPSSMGLLLREIDPPEVLV